jgi:predicted phage terminase large subunit-like protein
LQRLSADLNPYHSPADDAATTPARDRLAAFVEATTPWPLEPWQRIVCNRLEQLRDQTGQRLLIHGPPQFGKSIIISQRFPCWMIGSRPKTRVRLACYNQTHAERFSRVNLDLMRAPEFLAAFPDAGARVPAITQAKEWSTRDRAAQRDGQASFVALGLGSGFTGLGVDTLILDDPYKNREEAYSTATNEGIWAWWTEVVIPRLNPATNVVVMFHRWKEDDLAGRLLAQGGWEHLRFPAIADGQGDDPTGRAIGEPLTARYSVPYLRDVERIQGPLAFLSLYQGTPAPASGNLFRSAWFEPRYKSLPELVEVWSCWDTAMKAKEENDETACTVAGRGVDGHVYVLRAEHGRWETPDVAKFLVEQAHWLRGLYGDRYRGDYVEDKVSGTTLMQFVRRSNPELALIPVQVEADKVSRAHGVTPLCEAGQVLFPDLTIYPDAREWVDAQLAQLATFPAGAHDDLVDSFVYALKRHMGTLGVRKSRRGRGGGYV